MPRTRKGHGLATSDLTLLRLWGSEEVGMTTTFAFGEGRGVHSILLREYGNGCAVADFHLFDSMIAEFHEMTRLRCRLIPGVFTGAR
jgi:hypothetical protein